MRERFFALDPCPATPNCVSSQASNPKQRLRPLVVIGSPQEAMAAVLQLLIELKRTRIVEQSFDYIHVEVRTAIFGFVDDVEFGIDQNGLLQFRSSARIGMWDFGVNHRRMVRMRDALVRRYGQIFSSFIGSDQASIKKT